MVAKLTSQAWIRGGRGRREIFPLPKKKMKKGKRKNGGKLKDVFKKMGKKFKNENKKKKYIFESAPD